ncbi:MAG: hypothetical protein DHS20C02_11070 [Micavibrio sp.]|nr:MAG: hypothetical protein DHS20C02_11070 [Micavibrio sp.]
MARSFLIFFTVLTLGLIATTPAQAWLYPPNANAATGHISTAAAAIEACDEAAYNRSMRNLKNLEKTLKAIAQNAELAAGSGMTQNQAAHDWAVTRGFRQGLKARWEARPQPCTPPTEEQASNTAVTNGDALLAELKDEGCCTDIEERVAELEATTVKNTSQRKMRIKMPGDSDSEYESAIRRAEEGIASCNRDQFLDGMDWLDDLAEYARTDEEEEDVDRAMDNLERKWRAAGNQRTCYGLAYPTPIEFFLGADVGIMHAHDRFGNLASETTGGGNRLLNQAKGDTTGTYAALNFGAQIAVASVFRNMLIWGTPNAPNYNPYRFWDFFFALNRATADIHTNIGTFDPGAGRDILFPGTAVGPNASGFNGGANPALNVIYRASYAWAAYQMGFGYMMNVANSRLKVRPYGGLEYKRLRTSEELAGTIVGNNFSYITNVREHSYAPFVGVETAYRPKTLKDLFRVPVEVGSNLRYAYVFNNASGTDDLKLGANPTAPAAINNDDHSHDMAAELNLTFMPDNPFNVSVGGKWERTSVPMLNSRDGVRPSSLGREDVDNATFMFRMNWSFGIPNMGNTGGRSRAE